jgi:hypothetical protein
MAMKRWWSGLSKRTKYSILVNGFVAVTLLWIVGASMLLWVAGRGEENGAMIASVATTAALFAFVVLMHDKFKGIETSVAEQLWRERVIELLESVDSRLERIETSGPVASDADLASEARSGYPDQDEARLDLAS